MRTKASGYVIWLVFVVALVSSGAVRAEADHPDSLFRNAISWIIGIPGGNLADYIAAGGESTSVLSTMSIVLNSAALIISVVIGLWTLLSGTLGTAKEGEFMGKRYDSAWVPIRSVVSIAALMPLGGYSAVQLFFIWVVGLGWGIADEVAKKRLEHIATVGAEIAPKTAHAGDLVLNLARLRVCQAIANDGPGDATNVVVNVNTVESGNTVQRMLVFDGTEGSGYPLGVCGQLSINYQKNEAGSDAGTGEQAVLAAVSETAFETAVAIVESPEMTKLVQMLLTANGDDAGGAPADMDTIMRQVAKLAQEYDMRVSKAAASHITSLAPNEAFLKEIDRYGWVAQGAINWTIKSINDAIIEMASIRPQVSGPTLGDAMPFASQKDYLAAMRILDAAQKNYRHYIGFNSYRFASLDQGAGVVSLSGETGIWDKVVLKVAEINGAVIQRVINYLHAGTVSGNPTFSDYLKSDPARQLKEIGDVLIYGGESLAAAAIIGKSVGDSLEGALKWLGPLGSAGSGLLGGITNSVGFILLFFAIYLFFFGFVLSMYIPAIPFMFWIAGVFRVLSLMVAAFIGVPVWAAAHAIPEGEGIAGQHARAGYMVLIALLARPMFMVFGLVAGDLLLKVMSIIMSILFVPAIKSVHIGSFMGLITFLFNLALFVIMTLVAVRTSYSLINRLGDWAMRFVGGTIEGLGEEQEEREHHSAFVNVVNIARHGVQKRPGRRAPLIGNNG